MFTYLKELCYVLIGQKIRVPEFGNYSYACVYRVDHENIIHLLKYDLISIASHDDETRKTSFYYLIGCYYNKYEPMGYDCITIESDIPRTFNDIQTMLNSKKFINRGVKPYYTPRVGSITNFKRDKLTDSDIHTIQYYAYHPLQVKGLK